MKAKWFKKKKLEVAPNSFPKNYVAYNNDPVWELKYWDATRRYPKWPFKNPQQ